MRVDSGGVGIEVSVSGRDDGKPVLLLHGFPDSGRVWRHQVPALVDGGFRVIVPDLRGYGASDKPNSVDAYGAGRLLGDIIAVLGHTDAPRAHIVGHDWGAALAWALAMFMPDRVDHLVALSVGHPVPFRTAGLEQKQKSWYMLLFLFEGVAERWLSQNDWANFRQWAGHPDADAVIAELEANGSLTPALNWYRANLPAESWIEDPPQRVPVQAPTLGIWSSGDPAATEAQMVDSAKHVAGDWRYERLDGVGHWLQLEAPETINRLLLDFLR